MKEFIKDYGIIMFSTTELIVTIVLSIFAGQWVDRHFHWDQKALITATIVGAILGFVRFVVRLQKVNKDAEGSGGDKP